MRALWQVCEEAKRPSGFLMVKIQDRGFLGVERSELARLARELRPRC